MNHYLTQLVSNAKGGFDLNLEPCALVVGENGQGKSGVRTALELILRGENLEFGKTGQRVMEMAPEDAGSLTIEGKVSDGKTLHYIVEGSISRASRPVWTVGGEPVGKTPAVILSDEVAALMGSKSDKALRAALLRVTVGDVDPQSVTADIPEAYRALWEARWTRALETCETVADALLTVRRIIDDELKEIRKRRKADMGERPEAPTRAQVDELGRRMWELRQKGEHGQASAGVSLHAVTPETPEIAQMRQGAVGIRASIEVLELMRAMASDDTVPCMTCRANTRYSLEQIGEMLVTRRDQGVMVQQALQGLIDAARKHIAQEALHVPQEPVKPIAPSLLIEAEVAYGEALAAQSAQESWDKASALRRRAESDEKVHKALRAAVDTAVEGVLEGRVQEFCDRATAYLPEGEKLHIALVNKGKAICRVGLSGGQTEGFRTWRALCGAERTRVIAAIAGAWGKIRDEAIRLVIIDEVWLGQRALSDLCAGLRQAVYEGALTQVVVFAVEAKDTPEGWGRVELGGA